MRGMHLRVIAVLALLEALAFATAEARICYNCSTFRFGIVISTTLTCPEGVLKVFVDGGSGPQDITAFMQDMAPPLLSGTGSYGYGCQLCGGSLQVCVVCYVNDQPVSSDCTTTTVNCNC